MKMIKWRTLLGMTESGDLLEEIINAKNATEIERYHDGISGYMIIEFETDNNNAILPIQKDCFNMKWVCESYELLDNSLWPQTWKGL